MLKKTDIIIVYFLLFSSFFFLKKNKTAICKILAVLYGGTSTHMLYWVCGAELYLRYRNTKQKALSIKTEL